MSLRLVGSNIAHMGPHTYMWVDSMTFAIEGDHSDEGLLTALVANDAYAYDYASVFDPSATVVEPAIHGRWWRSSVTSGSFEPCSREDAEAVLQDWADHQEWVDPEFRQPPDAQERLRQIYAVLSQGLLYRLESPGPEYEHEWGWVVGGNGFYEFVVIDRARSTVQLVVASDD